MAEEKADLEIKPQGDAPEGDTINPLDQKEEKADDSALVSSIVSTETATGEENILGAAPEIDQSLLQGLEPPKSLLLLILKIVFVLLLVASVSAFAFFSTQLTTRLEGLTAGLDIPNVAQDLASTNAEIIKLQTDINFNRYLRIKGYLDIFSYSGDSYLQNYEVSVSQTASDAEKRDAGEEMSRLKTSMREALKSARDLYVKSLFVPLADESEGDLESIFKDGLTTALSKEAQSLAEKSEPEAQRDFKNYVQAMGLVSNQELKDLIVQADFDAMSAEQLYTFIKKINSLLVNDLTIIQNIKDARIKWSDIINEIDLRTIAVDGYYTDDFYNELGGIRYTSYDFDSTNRSIAIVGETKRFDTTNFTMIANLIDEFNRSDLFEGAEMKSFSKSGSLTDGYTAVLKLALNLANK